MSDEHPTYPNPTIVEAACDIHFRLSQTKEWKPSLPGELFKHIQKETSVSHITEQEQKNFALAQLLRSRREGDEREQRDTWKRLKRALDEDRLSDRKLFP